MPEILDVFVGYDKAEPVAYHTCCESIISNSSLPVRITPLWLPTLEAAYGRQKINHQTGYKPSNGFIFSRFLVPHMMNFKGRALFVDGDMIIKGDIAELFDNDKYPMSGLGVRVVKHEYKTTAIRKYLGSVNLDYPMKNWSSVILWNCNFFPNQKLTPQLVMNSSGEYLHRFQWLEQNEIGELDKGWNVLADEPNQAEYNDAKLIHYTLGTPCFADYRTCQYGDDWWKEYESAIYPLSRKGESQV